MIAVTGDHGCPVATDMPRFVVGTRVKVRNRGDATVKALHTKYCCQRDERTFIHIWHVEFDDPSQTYRSASGKPEQFADWRLAALIVNDPDFVGRV